MNTKTELPEWLDDYIFSQLGASYHRKCNEAEYNKDSDEPGVQQYLGTYFPRSYAEVRCIAENLFKNKGYNSLLTDNDLSDNVINILDLGCGTGGDILGLLSVLSEKLPDACINVYAFDANETALWYMCGVVNAFARTYGRIIHVWPEKLDVSSESDFLQMAQSVGDNRFDYILCCKACAELKSRHVIEQPYFSAASTFSALLKDNGIMLILDVACQPDGCAEYLPKEMNYELNSFVSSNPEFGTLVPRPCGAHPECKIHCYMLKRFFVPSPGYPIISSYPGDSSNVCYRIIGKQGLVNKVIEQAKYQNQTAKKSYIIHADNAFKRRSCPWFIGGIEVDAFDISS